MGKRRGWGRKTNAKSQARRTASMEALREEGQVPPRNHFFFFLAFFRAAPKKVPRLGVKSEVQLQVYTTAPAKCDPSLICDLHHSSRHRRIRHPVSEARGRTHILMDPLFLLCHNGYAMESLFCFDVGTKQLLLLRRNPMNLFVQPHYSY